ncbi:MAG TPA: ScpA family protein [Candidatus Binatia bacterium]|nr:ScpA family protein [Candidatus Binatia bacterium]
MADDGVPGSVGASVAGVAPAAVGAVRPAIRIAETARPEAAIEVELGEFEGPLGLLLALIEARRLDVLTVPLGALAEAYLEALATAPGDRLGNVSAFVAVASQLILIKSRALLPRPPEPTPGPEAGLEEPDPEAVLRHRLLVYRAFRDRAAWLAERAASGTRSFRREAPAGSAARLAGQVGGWLRPDRVDDPRLLVEALAGLARISPPPPLPPEVVPRVVTLAERARIIRAALRAADEIVLQDLLAGTRDRVVVAVTFLALLELVKRREVAVDQSEPWGPIRVRRLPDEAARWRVVAGGEATVARGGEIEP